MLKQQCSANKSNIVTYQTASEILHITHALHNTEISEKTPSFNRRITRDRVKGWKTLFQC